MEAKIQWLNWKEIRVVISGRWPAYMRVKEYGIQLIHSHTTKRLTGKNNGAARPGSFREVDDYGFQVHSPRRDGTERTSPRKCHGAIGK